MTPKTTYPKIVHYLTNHKNHQSILLSPILNLKVQTNTTIKLILQTTTKYPTYTQINKHPISSSTIFSNVVNVTLKEVKTNVS